MLARVAELGITLEVCPTSNVSLGVYPDAASVPLRVLLDADARVALGADDPLLFGARLAEQYELARTAHAMSDAELAALARMSVEASVAPVEVKARLIDGIAAWLAQPAKDRSETPTPPSVSAP